MTRRRLVPAALAGLALVVTGCVGTPAPPPSPSAAPATPPAATAPPESPDVPSPPPSAAVAGLVDIPEAGIRLPVPPAWERVPGDQLADGASRADIVARYPGMAQLLDAAERMGDRAVPAFLAMDSSAAPVDGVPPPSVSVLVAQPAVSGPLLDLVAGFISDGLVEAFGGAEPERSRVVTPVGEAIRLGFALPSAGGVPLAATAYVIAGEEGTLLVTVIGPTDEPPGSDPDAVVQAAAPLP